MNLSKLKRFAQETRKKLISQIGSRLDYVLSNDDSYLRAHEKEKNLIKERLKEVGRNRLLEEVSYTWFNRIGALLYMDNRYYNRTRIVSPAEGESQPELLSILKRGEILHGVESVKDTIFGYLDGRVAAEQPDREAYKTALLAYCNHLGVIMPFLFKKVDDWAALLLPTDMLSSESIIFDFQQNMTSEDCEDIEIIGWLYQFYISEKKDEVFADLKKNIKISPENIPAATQLFTPHWIVRYLVENSLGRLWMLNRPESRLTERMDYYIKPEEAETDFLKVDSPEEIKICDPACGSGHMLVYAFDLLFAMYEEEGYTPAEIPELIITRNLYGIEIDERAGELAAFALTMKAREKDRRFLERNIQPNICVLQKVRFDSEELKAYRKEIGDELFAADFIATLQQFEEADNFGSLIRPEVENATEALLLVKQVDVKDEMYLQDIHERVLTVLKQAEYLSQRYHVVVANPPYMGGKGMNGRLSDWIRKCYSDGKSDLFAAFVFRILSSVLSSGYIGLMTPFTWMYLKSFGPLRKAILDETRITGLVQPEYHSFFESAYVPICAFNLQLFWSQDAFGVYIDLQQFYGASIQSTKALEAIRHPDCTWRHEVQQSEFKIIPSSPIAFTVSDQFRKAFRSGKLLGEIAEPRQGLATANNDLYLRTWSEVAKGSIRVGFLRSDKDTKQSGRWVPYQKGGSYRKWYGNHELVIDWRNDGYAIKSDPKAVIRNPSYYFKKGMSWTSLTVSSFNGRYCPEGFIFDSKGPVLFPKQNVPLRPIIALMNSIVVTALLKVISPTMDFSQGPVGSVPYRDEIKAVESEVDVLVKDLIHRSKSDWDSYENSWDFTILPLLQLDYCMSTLQETYQKLRYYWRETILEMQRLEEENNRIFIDAYGLAEELTPEVPLNEITLTCNPWYRYGKKCEHQEPSVFPEDSELEARLKADTIKEYISYAVGCLFGRYSLDEPGLVLANAGDGVKEYYQQIPHPTFPPDESGILPLTEEDDFTDDLPTGVRKFIRTTFGEERYEENLRFIEDALGKSLRSFLLKDLYKDHVKRYKKRPIYWQITSPSGIFRCLIYLHRYTPETAGQVLNEYIRPYIKKLEGRISQGERMLSSGTLGRSEEARTRKNIDRWRGMVGELTTWERDVVYPLATERIALDLDDGVKVNYGKLGAILEPVKGLNK